MIKEIIYGKRQAGKTTFAIKQMMDDGGKSMYVCYNQRHVKDLMEKYPVLTGRITNIKDFIRNYIMFMKNFDKFYFQ